jgi:hypothetical protein
VAEQELPGLGQIIQLPRFRLPFPGGIHPGKDSVIGHSCQWALASRLVPDENDVARLRRGGIMTAGPRLVPGASMKAAYLVCDWTVFLIVIDDVFDEEAEFDARPELARVAIEDVIGAFGGHADEHAVRVAHMAGITAAAADLGRRFKEESPSPAWLVRFRRDAEAHIWSKVSETEHRAATGILDVPAYVALRRITSAAYTYADLVEMTAQVVIPEPVRELPAWQRMLDAFADVWLGIQDICSCAKEVSSGDDLNLAAVMARSSGSTLQQGVDDAYRWVRERSEDFATQRAHLCLGDEAEAEMTRYLDALEYLLGGHLAWNSQDNPRYSQVISSI